MNRIRYTKSIIFLLTLSIIFSGFLCETVYSGSTWLLVDTPRPSSQGGIFETDLKFTTWDAAIGAYTIAVHYAPSIMEIVQVIVPVESEFFGNTFIDQNSFKSGSTNISAFQVTNSSDITSPSTFATIQWKAVSALGASQNISLEAKAIIDSSWRPVDVSTWGIISNNNPIQLLNPSNSREFTSCDYYNSPIFQWASNQSFKSMEVQFSKDNFSTVSVKAKVKASVSQLQVNPSIWKKILLLPGNSGGNIYWKVVGTKADKSKENSNTLFFTVKGPEPAGNITISPTSVTSMPTLSWQSSCNTKFKAWFGSDNNFTGKKALTFTVKNPNDNGGVFTKTLTSNQWNSIKKMAGNLANSTIYWHVESWDAMKRYSKTEVKDFTLLASLETNNANYAEQDYAKPEISNTEIWPMFGHDPQHTGRSSYSGPSTMPTSIWTSSLFETQYAQIIFSSDGAEICGTGSYMDNEQNCIIGLDIATGLMKKYVAASNIWITPAVDSSGSIYFGDDLGNIYALNPDFTVKWKNGGYFGFNNYLNAPPTIGPDGSIYMVGSDSINHNPIICVTPEGVLKWAYNPINTPIASLSPAIATDGTIYVGAKNDAASSNGGLIALNPDGSLKWEYTLGETLTLSPAIGSDDTVYIGTNQYLYAINPDGSLKWRIGGTEYELSMPSIGPDGTIYIDLGDSLSAIHPEDGSIKWIFNLILNFSYLSNENTIAIASDGTVYIGSQDYLHAINPDGSVKWQYYSPNAFFMSPIIGQDGTIYVHHDVNEVSALSE